MSFNANKKYKMLICKNCGKSIKSKLDQNLCSIPCIKAWREEEEEAKRLKR